MATNFEQFINRHNTVNLLQITGISINKKGGIDKVEFKNQFGEKLVVPTTQLLKTYDTGNGFKQLVFKKISIYPWGLYRVEKARDYDVLEILNHHFDNIPLVKLPKTNNWSGYLQNPVETVSCFNDYYKFVVYTDTVIRRLFAQKQKFIPIKTEYYVYTPVSKEFNLPIFDADYPKNKVYYTKWINGSALEYGADGTKISEQLTCYANDLKFEPKIPKNVKGDILISAVYHLNNPNMRVHDVTFIQINYSLKTKNFTMRLIQPANAGFLDEADPYGFIRGDIQPKELDISKLVETLIKVRSTPYGFEKGKIEQYEVFSGPGSKFEEFINSIYEKRKKQADDKAKNLCNLPRFKLIQYIIKNTKDVLSKFNMTIDNTPNVPITRSDSKSYIAAHIDTGGSNKYIELYNKDLFNVLDDTKVSYKCNGISYKSTIHIGRKVGVTLDKYLTIMVNCFADGCYLIITLHHPDKLTTEHQILLNKFLNGNKKFITYDRCSLKKAAEVMKDLFTLVNEVFDDYKICK